MIAPLDASDFFFSLLNVKELPVSISGIDSLNSGSSPGNYTGINKLLVVFDDDSRFFWRVWYVFRFGSIDVKSAFFVGEICFKSIYLKLRYVLEK